MLEFRILGPLEAVADGQPVRLGGPKQRATLAILLLNANRVVPVERLADELYAGAAPVTAVTQVQRQVSELRKALGSSSQIETRAPGYLLRLDADELDLSQFERLVHDASRALAQGDGDGAASGFRTALELWRGPALADLAYESFARAPIERLEEIRLNALEERVEADLALGRHAAVVGELEELVSAHPLRERFRAQLMLALYRSGRQAEALEVHRRTREELIDAFGIEPTSELRDLERAILTQDASLDLPRSPSARPGRTVLVLTWDDTKLDGLLSVAEPLARLPERELIVTRLLSSDETLRQAVADLNIRVASSSVAARVAAFTTSDPAGDAVRFAIAHAAELVLVDAPTGLDANPLPEVLTVVFERSPADVAVVTGAVDLDRGEGVYVVFGGGEHDWAALELGAWFASATGRGLTLVGTTADERRGRRDASRLLADASLAVQRVVGVSSEPLLAEPAALLDAVDAATLIVAGISPRWRGTGIGDARRVIVRGARPPALIVHRGPGPGGLAPRETRTRFTWSIAG